MRFEQVTLATSADVDDFYARVLGLGPAPYSVGETTLEFVRGEGEPFYHYALLVPGDRFEAALEWAGERVELLPGADGVVFDFDNWDAHACYFADPAGSIVELIALRGVGESATPGKFHAAELVGFSELGLVGDRSAMAVELARIGIDIWSGTVDEPDRLAFAGERARTLILAPPGRGWLPTGRPAEPHPVHAVVSTGRPGAMDVGGVRIQTV